MAQTPAAGWRMLKMSRPGRAGQKHRLNINLPVEQFPTAHHSVADILSSHTSFMRKFWFAYLARLGKFPRRFRDFERTL